MKRKWIITAILALTAAATGGFSYWHFSDESAAPVRPTDQDSPLFAFVFRHLVDSDGGVYTNLRSDMPTKPDTATNHDKLSESSGLLLDYALRAGREDVYKQQTAFVRRHLLRKDGIVRWKTDAAHHEPAASNAAVDDLRIARFLLDGAARWQRPEDQALARRIADGLLQYNLEGGLLADFYEADGRTRGQTVTASYLDVAAMRRLADEDKRWQPVAEASLRLLESARQPAGFYAKTYDLSRRKWTDDSAAGYNLIDTLLAALNARGAGLDTTPTAKLMRELWQRDGKLYAAYDAGRQALTANESPAVYALAARLLREAGDRETGDRETAGRLMERMREFAAASPQPYRGGYVIRDTLESYSFDNLQALLAETEGEPS